MSHAIPLPVAPRRRALIIAYVVLWAIVIGLFTSWSTIYYHRTHGELLNDRDIWYDTGRKVCLGRNIYPDGSRPGKAFTFMYPPPAATILAPATLLGPVPFLLVLDTINSIAWVASVFLGVYLVMGRVRGVHLAVFVAPVLCCGAFIWDTYHLGQPNLVLLALLLGAFVLLRQKRDWAAGGLIALAAAFKAFPVLALVYLVYRRHWRAAGWTAVFLAGLLFLLPVPVRGWTRNLDDLRTWTDGMILHYDTHTIAQRSSAYRWKNQSIIAAVNRLFRHVPGDIRKVEVNGQTVEVPVYTNVADLSFTEVNAIVVGVGLALCLGYIAAMPSRLRRTARSDAIEVAMLLVMMILFSPLSWYYYGVWLLPAVAVVVAFAFEAPARSARRRLALLWLALSLVLLNLVVPLDWVRPIRAVGITFFGDLVLLAELAWVLRRAVADHSAAPDRRPGHPLGMLPVMREAGSPSP